MSEAQDRNVRGGNKLSTKGSVAQNPGWSATRKYRLSLPFKLCAENSAPEPDLWLRAR